MEQNLEQMVIPEHVAVILDGNGRWAKRRGVPRAMGHKQGCVTLEQVVEDAARMGIRYFTVYGFSTENWKRSEEEVGALMKLLRYYMVRLLKVASENNIRVKMIGEKSRFAADIVKGIDALVEGTKDNTGMTFVIAINYGGRDEIVRAARKLVEDYRRRDIVKGIDALVEGTKDNTGMTFVIAINYGGRDEIVRAARKLVEDYRRSGRDVSQLTEAEFASYLDTRDIPDPDLLIRTSGELRLSNYLLWQLAYTEIYITDCLWPDFNKEELEKAIIAYNGRERRFGGRK